MELKMIHWFTNGLVHETLIDQRYTPLNKIVYGQYLFKPHKEWKFLRHIIIPNEFSQE